jgi:phosphoribosyl 1,2-cyclic phosphodiesterase
MDSVYDLFFLGTGGGRFATATQKRRTAGIRIIGDNVNIHLDPGPGALVYSINSLLDPQELNAILVSHCHPDHYTDAEVMIEAMTHGTIQRHGLLAAAKSVLRRGNAGYSRVISGYHQHMPEKVIEAMPDLRFECGSLGVMGTGTRHTDPDAVGFRFGTSRLGDFAYTSDTEYFEGLTKYYEGVRLLVLCVMRPGGKPFKGHMTTDDAARIVEEVHPQLAIFTHLGMKMLLEGPAKEAKNVKEKTGVNTIAATDGMHVIFGEKISIRGNGSKSEELSEFF